MKEKDVQIMEFQQKGDERGSLIVVEGTQDIPFDIKRVFYISGSDQTVVRGQHANLRSKFVLINVGGSSKVKIKDGRGNEKIYVLDKPHMGLYIPEMIWKEMYDFSQDSILLCLASEHYDAAEYIRDYNDYVKIVNQ